MLSWLDDKHRLVVVNDETFQEVRSFRLSMFNVFAILGSAIMVVSFITMLLMMYTPLGNLVPQRNGVEVRSQINEMYVLLDSLQQAVTTRDEYIAKMGGLVLEEFEYEKDVVEQEKDNAKNSTQSPENGNGGIAASTAKNDELKALMERVENEQELGNLVESTIMEETSVDAMILAAPLKGIVSDSFAPHRRHFGIDIIAPKGELIKATQSGTVVVSTWSADTGHMLGIQHENNTISFYKHNSALLKKEGDVVRAGEGIAIIGNSGEMTDGPHLHFELWFRGQPINAERYISFRN